MLSCLGLHLQGASNLCLWYLITNGRTRGGAHILHMSRSPRLILLLFALIIKCHFIIIYPVLFLYSNKKTYTTFSSRNLKLLSVRIKKFVMCTIFWILQTKTQGPVWFAVFIGLLFRNRQGKDQAKCLVRSFVYLVNGFFLIYYS